MSTRSRTPTLCALWVTCALLVAPAAAQAGSSGGSGLTGSPGNASNPLVQPAYTPLTTSADGVTLDTVAAVEQSRRLVFTGSVAPGYAGRVVLIEISTGAGPEPQWTEIARAPVAPSGLFITAWRAQTAGRFEVEAVVPADGTAESTATGPSGAGAASPSPGSAPATPPLTISVYQPAVATLYGPGLYGGQTACGETLGRRTLGVASRTLACGTLVSIVFGDREIVVPVIDRGPFANGAEWDLTMATARMLGLRTTTTIGTLQVQNG